MLPKKLKRLLKSSPATVELIKYLENSNGNSSSSGYDDSDLKTKMGYANIPNNTNLQEEIDTHTHTESDISDLGSYSETGHTHTVSDITDFPNIEFIKIVSNKGTASASTLNKLYIEVDEHTTDIFYTVEDDGSYSWEKLDSDVLDDLSIDWSDVENKPNSFTPTAHAHGNITDDGLLKVNNSVKSNKVVVTNGDGKITYTETSIPTDVSDLTDSSNTQFTPKSHTHTESDISDLGDYVEKSQTSGLLKNDGTVDTNTYLTQHQDISGKANTNHNHTLSNITDVATVEATITYADDSTETVLLVKKVTS